MVVRTPDWHPNWASGCADGIKLGHDHAPLSDVSVVVERDRVWSPVIPSAFKEDARAGLSVGDRRLMDVEAACVIVEETRSPPS